MNKLILFLLLFPIKFYGQYKLTPGIYEELRIAYDSSANYVTGYYENGTGYDKKTGSPIFSCIFYIEGTLANDTANIKTYFPCDTDIIEGKLSLNKNEVKILLSSEHGGCWNVQHFTDSPVNFIFEQHKPWIQIRYAVKDKVYFYSEQNDMNKLKAYIVKGDIVYIEKINNDWVFCSFSGKRITQGWIRLSDLNQLP